MSESTLLALPPRGTTPPSVNDVRERLDGAGIEVTRLGLVREREGARWEAEVEARLIDEQLRSYRIWLEPAPRSLLEQLFEEPLVWQGVLAEDRADAIAATWAIGVQTTFGERVLFDYHAELKVLSAMAPEAVLLFDEPAVSPRPGAWLLETAASLTPPPPEALYAIHCVTDDGGAAWLHTHGLDRCGSIELDLVDVPADFVSLAATLLNVVSARFIERGVPDAGEPFAAGRDIELVWLPWHEAVTKVRRDLPGGNHDRKDEAHGGFRGVIFPAPDKGLFGRARYRSVASLRPVLESDPLLYLSEMATDRAALLAKERLPRFRQLFARFASTDEWLFLVKLGYPIDDAESPRDREHLWFEVSGLDGDEVEAKLLNQPYGIAALREGAVGRHALSRLSDWVILCPHGRFAPPAIGNLERLVGLGSRDQ